MRSFFSELKRRNVYRAAAFYAAAGWLLVQIATQVFPIFDVPTWTMRLVVVAVIVGFPFALAFSWFYEWTSQGIQRESDVEHDESIARTTGKKLDRWIIAILSLAVVLLVADKFVLHKDAITIADKSIAVLPFENRSADHAQDYYADGLTDELTTALARISALKVIARTSAARYKDTHERPAAIGHELGVAALVTGSVLRANGRVRYTADLVAADSETNLWAESYERDEADVLTLQSEVARAIAKAIEVRLSPVESERLAGRRPVDPRAFEEYLRGRALWNLRTEQSVREALTHFQNATRIAPAFALAYAGVADSHIILGVHGFDPPRVAIPAAKAAAAHAIELDPGAGEPHASLGDILFHYDWDWAASEREHRRAIELAPAFATAYQWDSEALILSGDVEGALVQLRRARALDPLSMIIRASLAQTLALLGRRDEAIAELRDALTLDPTFPRTRRELARQLLASGHTDEALSEARKLAERAPDNLPALATLGLCLGRAGHAEEARALLRRLESERGKPFVSTLEFARITAGLGDRTATLGYLERAVEAREGFLPFIGVDPEFDFLHGEPRYAAIVREIGIPPR